MEQTVKKRGWVKNAAIIFLAVMLVLTFFSNTILNRSLPEAATVLCLPGTIDSKVRVSGTVSAKENYSVILDQTRKVLSVAVKQGQEVATGDLLFTLEPGDSTELEQAKEELRQAQVAYQRMLINAAGSDYSRENRSIEQARQELVRAQEQVETLSDSQALQDELQAKVDAAQAKADSAAQSVTALETELSAAKADQEAFDSILKDKQKELKNAQYGYNHSSEGTAYTPPSTSGLSEQVAAAQVELLSAQNTLQAAEMAYGTDYTAFEATARLRIDADHGGVPPESYDTYLPYYLELLANEYKAYNTALPGTAEYAMYQQYVAYAAVVAARENLAAAQSALRSAQSALEDAYASGGSYEGPVNYDGKTHSYWEKEVMRLELVVEDAQEQADEAGALVQKREAALSEAKAALEGAKTDLTVAQDEQKEKLKNREGELESARTAVRTAENALADLVFSLEQQKKDDGKAAQLNALELQEQQAQIARLQDKVEELGGANEQGAEEIRSKVNGTVKSLTVSAGHKAAAGDSVMEIEVSDLGYTMTATVTGEQARLLHVGDTASVNNYYWGNPTTAEITQIRPDPKNPQDSKQVTFEITGNVSAGSTLSFAIGEKNASYDYVVPNSAVRSDTNGKFLLIITAKNSPLGNRYFATRVNVEVVASDDLNSAVKGPLEGHESVILTTGNNAPLKNGDQVRLPDVN